MSGPWTGTAEGRRHELTVPRSAPCDAPLPPLPFGFPGPADPMTSPPSNPYRTDYPGAGFFSGRASEIALLVESMLTGRQSLAAVMGGRGMGKTSLALRIQSELSAD